MKFHRDASYTQKFYDASFGLKTLVFRQIMFQFPLFLIQSVSIDFDQLNYLSKHFFNDIL